MALSTALLLPGDLERNAKMIEYENYAFMLQHSVQMKKLEDQAEAATKAQSLAEEKAESAEAIKKVAEAEKKEAEDKKAQAEKEPQDALSTKDVEIKAADEKAYAQGMANVTEEYKLQEEDEALVRKPKDADRAKSPPQNEQVLDLTQAEEGDEVIPGAVPDTVPADIPSEVKTVEQTLQEIDAEIAAEKEAEVVSDLQIQ
ncbi:methyl-CpG-binding domain-containing protein 10-like [Camellia sinensis]|uniref:methyl-CpG-binding domain-containing protein 10-like n=1 Tax=Camellia sinensis TaxID=4442 RepID=UPI0010366AE3|nr:methyl-CpG-binding domain-containing protein 10-like [Camellia sinensis]